VPQLKHKHLGLSYHQKRCYQKANKKKPNPLINKGFGFLFYDLDYLYYFILALKQHFLHQKSLFYLFRKDELFYFLHFDEKTSAAEQR